MAVEAVARIRKRGDKGVKLTDALIGEHGAFFALFDTIEEVAGAAGDVAQIESAAAALAAEIKSHARLEEELLFPALEPHVGLSALFAEMRAEHERIRRGLHRIENARDVNEALEAVRQTLIVARAHFRNEENILYPFAEKVLDDETLLQLGETWAAVRKRAKS